MGRNKSKGNLVAVNDNVIVAKITEKREVGGIEMDIGEGIMMGMVVSVSKGILSPNLIEGDMVYFRNPSMLNEYLVVRYKDIMCVGK